MSHGPQPYFVNIYRVPNTEQYWIGGKCRTREDADRIALLMRPVYRLRVVEKPKAKIIGRVYVTEAPPADWDVGNTRAIFRAGAIVASCMIAVLIFIYTIRNFL